MMESSSSHSPSRIEDEDSGIDDDNRSIFDSDREHDDDIDELKIYPSFPDEYTSSTLNDENMEDFINVVETSLENKINVDPRCILTSTQMFHRSTRSSDRDRSDLLSRCVAKCIEAYLATPNREKISIGMNILQLQLRFPLCLLDDDYVDLYRSIDINDFVENIAVKMKTNDRRDESYDGHHLSAIDRDYLKLANTYVFFTLTMRWLINFENLTSQGRNGTIELFQNFAEENNFAMALPFSFFAPLRIVKRYVKRRVRVPRSTSSYDLASFDYIKTFRIEDEAKGFLFDDDSVPDSRVLRRSIASLQTCARNMPELHSVATTGIRAIRVLGIVPFRSLSSVKFDDESSKILYEKLHKSYRYSRYRRLRNFVGGRKDNAYEDDEDEECIVCLDSRANTIFFTCRHLVCCFKCSLRLESCPVCRTEISGIVSNAETYDNFQKSLMIETFAQYTDYFTDTLKSM